MQKRREKAKEMPTGTCFHNNKSTRKEEAMNIKGALSDMERFTFNKDMIIQATQNVPTDEIQPPLFICLTNSLGHTQV